jgi:hypothetical protein
MSGNEKKAKEKRRRDPLTLVPMRIEKEEVNVSVCV